MTPKTYNRFKAMGYSLTCKICEQRVENGEIPIEQAEIKPFDEVESKASGKGPKLYHAECYDNFHLEFDDENLKYEDGDDDDDDNEEEG
jgi:hypothetical protein